MIRIEFGNVTCQATGIEAYPEVERRVAHKLSYEVGGFGVKPGRKYLYSMTTHRTYTGLIPYIVQILKKASVPFELVDRRVVPTVNTPMALAEGITPRDYQQNILDHRRSRMVVQAATGAGKTLIMAGMIAEFSVTPCVVISKNATLSYQLRDEIQRFLGRPVGLLNGDVRDVRDVMVATPQIALKSDVLKECRALLVDECQFLGSATMFAVCRAAVNAYYRIAVSATPWRDGNDDLLIEAAINVRNPSTNVNASTLIRKGKLTRCVINFLRIPEVANCRGTYDAMYHKAISDNAYRNDRVLEIIHHERALNHGSILVLFQRVSHGRHLLQRIRTEVGDEVRHVVVNGVRREVHKVELISGATSMDDRTAILQAAREGIVEILLGSTIADEGLDCPALKVLILAGGGKSSTRAFQRVGRVLRLYAGCETAYVWDMMDMTGAFHDHYRYRRALYETEPEWRRNIHVVDRVADAATMVNDGKRCA